MRKKPISEASTLQQVTMPQQISGGETDLIFFISSSYLLIKSII